MPRGQRTHRRKTRHVAHPTWEAMLTEEGVRNRILREEPNVVKLLDYFAKWIRPFPNESGQTVFENWLKKCFGERQLLAQRPSDVPYVAWDRIRNVLFLGQRRQRA